MDIHTSPKILLKLHKRRAEIDLSPEYQRGKVWSKDKQQLLIDTVLKKMHVPPVYFRVLDNGYYECVDGQQRLTAIFDFFDNKYALSKKYSEEVGGLFYKELPNKIKDNFEDFEIVVFELSKASDEEIRDMFDRLQRGMPLTSGEKLHAKSGEIHKFVSQLVENEFFKKDINVRDYRGAYYQMGTQITALELLGLTDVKFKVLDELHNKNNKFDSNSKEAQWIKKVINFLSRAFETKTPELHTRAGVISLYLLTSELMKVYSLKDKEKLIRDFVIDFEKKLREAEEKEDNLELIKYLNSISHSSDSASSIRSRHEILMNYFLLFVKDLELLDDSRGFTDSQRTAIYRKDKESCKMCNKKVGYKEFHADHIVPHIRGGKTTVDNGQVLCIQCNLKKGSKN